MCTAQKQGWGGGALTGRASGRRNSRNLCRFGSIACTVYQRWSGVYTVCKHCVSVHCGKVGERDMTHRHHHERHQDGVQGARCYLGQLLSSRDTVILHSGCVSVHCIKQGGGGEHSPAETARGGTWSCSAKSECTQWLCECTLHKTGMGGGSTHLQT